MIQAQEVRATMDVCTARMQFANEIGDLRLPQFYQRTPSNLLFGSNYWQISLEKDAPLTELSNRRLHVNNFALAPSAGDLVKLDLLRNGEASGDYEPTRIRLKDQSVTLPDEISSRQCALVAPQSER